MWRRVTRGLVVNVLALFLASALAAQTADITGSVDAPDPGKPQSGMVLVKGWILDPAQISKVELYVDDQFQHNLNTGLPRIDVEQSHPNYPGIQNIAPGFQTGFTASRFSNGPHTVSLKVFFSDGRVVNDFGRRTINIDNTINQEPFGSVDIPDLSASYNATGSFPVLGWAADTDGVANVEVWVDGGILQNAMYGDARPDVGNTMPDFPAAMFSGFIANIDSTRIVDGVHLLEVRAVDRLGLSRMLGRRQIQVFNSEATNRPFGTIDEPKRDAILYGTSCSTPPQVSPAVRPSVHITPVRGWALDLGTRNNEGRVSYLELMVDGAKILSTDNCGFLFGQYANCYGLPRYDVERYYPNYPDAPRAGYMFTLDVGALLALGNAGYRPGNHVLKVRVGDQQSTFAELPGPAGIPVFFTCGDNSVFAAAYGFIDIPTSFDYMKGTVTFQGWALSETAPLTSVEMIIDGDLVGSAQLGYPRPDVQEQYPFVTGSINSGWRFQMDTTRLSNSRHRLTARVVNSLGARAEIASVDFYVQNSTPRISSKGVN
jgi:N-acetylmuramoyl-L-alanine amidase